MAVLIDEKTASSGEMVAMSLLGMDNTKSFGRNSGGFTTVNSTRLLKDKTTLFLASGYSADRNKKIYRNKINPDVFIAKEVSEDDFLNKVKEWLKD